MADMGRRSVLAGAAAACLASKAEPQAKVGDPAPPFSVFTFEFKKIQFEAMRGKVVMLNYWATWCAPCREELPLLDAYYRRHAGDGLAIYAVKSENDQVTNQQLASLSKVLAFPLIWHLNGKGYGEINKSLPTNYVIDRAGVVRYAAAGAFSLAELAQVVTPLLREPAQAEPAPARL
jgi:cytochrome c biogenesis protein CcmG/thiol:disulfide interchange protein DsbE